jgi:hypothetical protein
LKRKRKRIGIFGKKGRFELFMNQRRKKIPTYQFRNKESGKEVTIFMSMGDYRIFIEEHPHLDQLPSTSLQIGDSILLGREKPGGAFRERLKDIKDSHIRSNVNTW